MTANNIILYHYYVEPRIRAGLERNTLWEDELHLQKLVEQCSSSVVSIEEENRRVYGSGFFVSQYGHVVTTTSFPAYKKILTVRYLDNIHEARVIVYDAKNKIALLKIEVENTPKITLAKYKSLKSGTISIALGNPAGNGTVMEPGVIKKNYSPASTALFIETTSMINNGNNGGPLIDTRGKVIGINLLVFHPQRNPTNTFFVIPVEQIIESLSPVIDINEYI